MIATVLGCGSIGKRHLKGLVKNMKDYGLTEVRAYDLNPERMQEALKACDNKIIISDNLEKSVENAEVLFICVPTSYHIDTYNEINKLGNFHLFIEKPLSHNLNGCDELLFNQTRSGKHCVIGYLFRLNPVIKRLKSKLEEKYIGRPISVRAECGAYLPLWHPWEKYQDFYMSWKVGGGGALLDISHEIDLLQYLFGDVEDVQGLFGTFSDLEISSDDLALGIFKFRNGIIGQLQVDLLQQSRDRYIKVIGTEGTIVADIINSEIRCFKTDSEDWEIERLEVNYDEIYEHEYMQFFNEINNHEKVLASLEDGISVMQVIEAIRLSSSLGTRIKLPIY